MRGYSKRGETITISNRGFLRAETVTATLLTSIDIRDPHMKISFRKQTNNQFDFLKFIFQCLVSGMLRWGDTLIMDNAQIHKSRHSFPLISEALRVKGVNILFMPTYSPELNPCELVFSKVKFYIRKEWMVNRLTFDQTICSGFKQVTKKNLVNYYRHCRELKNVQL